MNNLEENILSCLYLEPNLILNLIVDDTDFKNKLNKKVFQIFKQQYDDYGVIDIVGIPTNYKHLFTDDKSLNNFIDYVMNNIMICSPSATNFNYYQESLIKHNKNMNLLEIVDNYYNQKISQEMLFEQIHRIEQKSVLKNKYKLSEEEIIRLVTTENKNIHFRFNKLSDNVALQEHDFLVIAARTGLGKTGFVLNLVEDLSHSYKCLYFNLEMSDVQVYRRLIGIMSNIPIADQSNPKTKYQLDAVCKYAKELATRSINVISGPQTVRTIKNKIVNESKDEHVIVFIDYVGLIHSDNKRVSTYERVTEICQELRLISLEQNCTIILVSQLNRQAASSDSPKEPRMTELKDSGELEQSATGVILLHSDDYYNSNQEETSKIDVIIAKNRNGRTGKTELYYNKKTQKFEDRKENKSGPGQWRKQ